MSQMLSKYKIEDSGDTDLLPGGLYGKFEIEEANQKAAEEGGEPCTAKRILLGITKAGHTNDERSEDNRNNHHLDEVDENLTDRRNPCVAERQTLGSGTQTGNNCQYEGEENLDRKTH